MKNYPIDESSDSELHLFSSHRNANLMGAVTVNTSPQCSNVAASIFNTVLLVCVAPRSKRERTSSSIYSAELTITGYSTLSLQKWRKNVSFFVNHCYLLCTCMVYCQQKSWLINFGMNESKVKHL